MMPGILSRYIGRQFIFAVAAVFFGSFILVTMIDYLEMLRRTGDRGVSAVFVATITVYRVPFVTERILPFAVLVGAMYCYLNLSRRMELVVARSSGISAWQFTAPAIILAIVLGVAATTLYNPLSAMLREQSKRLESQVFGGGSDPSFLQDAAGSFWLRQRENDGQSIINAKDSHEQGIRLSGVTIFRFDNAGQFRERVEASGARLQPGRWRLDGVRIYANGLAPVERASFDVSTNLTPTQVRESFATPETVPFWQLASYIEAAERSGLAASAYRLQFYQLLFQPFYLAAMVFLAAAVSLRFFRFGGVQKMVLAGIGGGFLLYVLSKVGGDLSKAGLIHPAVAAGFPVFVGSLTGLVTLLYQEDG
jgi:lipopolysaccharide export system permease protein